MQTSRKWEKILAWLSNSILLIITLVISFVAFTGLINSVANMPIVGNAFDMAVSQQIYQDPMWSMLLNGSGVSLDGVVGLVAVLVKIMAVVLIIMLVLAFIATLSIRSRVFSAILFIIVAIISLLSVVFWFMAIPYGLIALLLFIRK